mgnify:FL=1|jgi:fatty-acid desaturase
MENTVLDISNNVKIRGLLVFNHLLGGYALYTAFSWNLLLLSYIIGFTLGGVGISIGYHRYFAHRTFSTNKFFEYALLAIGHYASLGSAITWVGVHREHHANSDTENDPHSPKYNGVLRTLIHVWKRYEIKLKYIKDMLKDNKLKMQHQYYFLILFAFIVALLLLVGPVYAAYLYSIPAAYVFYATGIVNSINHIGGKPHNIPLLNLITSGESYHLNHHNDSKAWKFGTYDPMSPIVRIIKNEN